VGGRSTPVSRRSSRDRVSVEIAGYLAHRVQTVITDTPLVAKDPLEAHRVFEGAASGTVA